MRCKVLSPDEVDEMLRMGFIEDVETILGKTPKDRQTALCQRRCRRKFDALPTTSCKTLSMWPLPRQPGPSTPSSSALCWSKNATKPMRSCGFWKSKRPKPH